MPQGENDIKETTLDNFEKVSWTVLCISRTSYNIMVCGREEFIGGHLGNMCKFFFRTQNQWVTYIIIISAYRTCNLPNL